MILIILLMIFSQYLCTIDMNLAEIQYLADHLTPLECRELVAAAHYKGFEKPNALDQAERKVPKDESCVQLLLHWNSEQGEGKGETHELLERRLRQIGKVKLADWLGRTVFRQLGKELERGMTEGFQDILNETTEMSEDGPTFQAEIESDPTEWLPIDSILYALAAGLLLTLLILIVRACYHYFSRRQKQKELKVTHYTIMDNETSGSESEDRFDVRDYVHSDERLITRR